MTGALSRRVPVRGAAVDVASLDKELIAWRN